MGKTIVIDSTRRPQQWHIAQRLGVVMGNLPTLLLYAALGVAGVILWLLMHLPVGARAKAMLVYAMAGCVGTFTLGWHMVRAQLAGAKSH